VAAGRRHLGDASAQPAPLAGPAQRVGYDGLLERRRQRPSPRLAPFAEVERILRLYREWYAGFNVRHFHQLVRRDEHVTLSYTLVKTALQTAGLVATRRARGRHRRRREPRPCFGELLHLDGSPHAWLALCPDQRQTLIAILDDATKRLQCGFCTGGIHMSLTAALRDNKV
jgi:hypothetical protein